MPPESPYKYAASDPIGSGDPWGLFDITLDIPKEKWKCKWVNRLLQFWAIRINQRLLDHWLEGTGTHMAIEFYWFDPNHYKRNEVLRKALNTVIRRAKKAECGDTVKYPFNRRQPSDSNESVTPWITAPMINEWRFWYECSTSATKCCGSDGKCSIIARADCDFHALDTVNFWNSPDVSFLLPPFPMVTDRLVRACNPKGRKFNVSANASRTMSRLASCD
jgi:hypothetical protein